MTKEEELNLIMQGKRNAKTFYLNHVFETLFNNIARISPIIIFPLLCMLLNNWWLLFGIPITYVGGLLFKRPIFAIFILIIAILYCWKYGFTFQNPTIIFLLSYLYGHITVSISKYFSNCLEKNKLKIEKSVDKEMSKYLAQLKNDLTPNT